MYKFVPKNNQKSDENNTTSYQTKTILNQNIDIIFSNLIAYLHKNNFYFR